MGKYKTPSKEIDTLKSGTDIKGWTDNIIFNILIISDFNGIFLYIEFICLGCWQDKVQNEKVLKLF